MKKWLVGILAIICASMPLSVAPAEALPQENFDSMLPVMDSILRCCVENDMTYDAGNPEFFWSVLYYYCANWAKDDPECEIVDGEPARARRAHEGLCQSAFRRRGVVSRATCRLRDSL